MKLFTASQVKEILPQYKHFPTLERDWDIYLKRLAGETFEDICIEYEIAPATIQKAIIRVKSRVLKYLPQGGEKKNEIESSKDA